MDNANFHVWYVTYKLDTGAQVNILPQKIYCILQKKKHNYIKPKKS